MLMQPKHHAHRGRGAPGLGMLSSFIMSSRKVVIDGVTYIRSRDAARTVSLALDYVSRLARQGVIAGKRVSGIWFVDLASLNGFIAEQERQKELLRARFAPERGSLEVHSLARLLFRRVPPKCTNTCTHGRDGHATVKTKTSSAPACDRGRAGGRSSRPARWR